MHVFPSCYLSEKLANFYLSSLRGIFLNRIVLFSLLSLVFSNRVENFAIGTVTVPSHPLRHEAPPHWDIVIKRKMLRGLATIAFSLEYFD